MKLRKFVSVLVLTLSAGWVSATAQDLTVYTQNTLHFSKNNGMRAKCKAFAGGMKAADVTVLQEVLGNTASADIKACIATAGLSGKLQAVVRGPFGRSSYKESYAILYKTGMQVLQVREFTYKNFARPPLAVLFKKQNRKFWVVDYHGTFGEDPTKTKAFVPRQLEAQAMYTVVYRTLRKSGFPVIIAGDWNLSTGDTRVFNDNTFHYPKEVEDACQTAHRRIIYPEYLTTVYHTSLKHAYDHLAFTDVFSHCEFKPYQSLPIGLWRSTASDHLGVVAKFWWDKPVS